MLKTPHPTIPWLYAAALLCFLLPWVDFSCQGQRMARMTGVQLITGAEVDDILLVKAPQIRRSNRERADWGQSRSWNASSRPSEDDEPERIASDARVTGSLACLVAGLLMSIPRCRSRAGALGALMAATLYAVFWLRPHIQAGTLDATLGEHAIEIAAGIGVGIALLMFLIDLIARRNKVSPAVIMSALTVIALMWFKTASEQQMARETEGAVEVQMVAGFWLTLLLSVAGGIAWLTTSAAPAARAQSDVPVAGSVADAHSSPQPAVRPATAPSRRIVHNPSQEQAHV